MCGWPVEIERKTDSIEGVTSMNEVMWSIETERNTSPTASRCRRIDYRSRLAAIQIP